MKNLCRNIFAKNLHSADVQCTLCEERNDNHLKTAHFYRLIIFQKLLVSIALTKHFSHTKYICTTDELLISTAIVFGEYYLLLKSTHFQCTFSSFTRIKNKCSTNFKFTKPFWCFNATAAILNSLRFIRRMFP